MPSRVAVLCSILVAVAVASAGLVRAAEDAPAASGHYNEDAMPPLVSARQVIERAFENFYHYDMHANLEFVVSRQGRVVLDYETELLRKFIDGRAHDLFYFEGDGDMRGRRVLRIQQIDRADDAFVFLPQLRRIRRTVVAQRADKMLGMDLTFEDLEIQRLENFEILGRAASRVGDEMAHIVTLKRLVPGSYDRVDFFIAADDYAMLEVRFYRRDALEPYKITHMERSSMQPYPHHVLPSQIDFIDREAGTETRVVYRRRDVDPELPSSRFSTSSLEKRLHISWMKGWNKNVEVGAQP